MYTSAQALSTHATLAAGGGGGKLYTLTAGAIVSLPAPSAFDVGHVGFRKHDNTAPYSVVQRADGGLISDWDKLPLVMAGDNLHLYNTGSEYLILSSGQTPNYGMQGQHRTFVPTPSLPGYHVHRGDRGATIRLYADTQSGNVYLPPRTKMGWMGLDINGQQGGYRNGFSLRFMFLGPTAAHFVAIYGSGHQDAPNDGSPISTGTSGYHHQYLIMNVPGEVIDLDHDGQGWFIVNNYKPSGAANRA